MVFIEVLDVSNITPWEKKINIRQYIKAFSKTTQKILFLLRIVAVSDVKFFFVFVKIAF